MKISKGMRIHFVSADRSEIVEKGSSCRVTGMVKTDREVYSSDFIHRWLELGFLKIFDKSGTEIKNSLSL
jgi:hypothetical protein